MVKGSRRASHEGAVDGNDETRAVDMNVSKLNSVVSGGAAKSLEKSSAVAAQATRRVSQDAGATQQTAGPATHVTISGAARSRIAAESAESTAATSAQQSNPSHATLTALNFLSALHAASSASGQTFTANRAAQLQAGLGALQRTGQANEAVLSHFAG